MKIYQLICSESDIAVGNSEQVLETTKNKKQLETIAIRFNEKFASKETDDTWFMEFWVKEIDIEKLKYTLTEFEINALWS